MSKALFFVCMLAVAISGCSKAKTKTEVRGLCVALGNPIMIDGDSVKFKYMDGGLVILDAGGQKVGLAGAQCILVEVPVESPKPEASAPTSKLPNNASADLA